MIFIEKNGTQSWALRRVNNILQEKGDEMRYYENSLKEDLE